MLSFLALFGAFSGAFVSLWSKILASASLLAALTCLCLLLAIRLRRLSPLFVVSVSALMSAAWAVYCAEQRMSSLWPESMWREPVMADVVIATIPHKDEHTGLWRFDADIERYQCIERDCDGQSSGRVRLHWYAPQRQLRSGDRWRLTLRLKRPRSLMNDGGFDYRRYAISQRLVGIGGVSRRAEAEYLGRQTGLVGGYRAWRQDYADLLSERWSGLSMRGLLLALSIGERRDISPSHWRLMQDSGVVHLMAISGLHIGIAAVAGWWLLSRLFAPFARLSAVALPASGLLAFSYAALAGFTLPTQRALIMVLAIIAAKMLRRRLSAWHGWRWALWLLLVTDPLVVLDTGFYLSFLAVAVLLSCSSGTKSRSRAGLLAPQLVICIALLPLTLAMNSQFFPLSVPANLLLIPLFSLFLVPAVLVVLVLLSLNSSLSVLSWLADVAIAAVNAVLAIAIECLDSANGLPVFQGLAIASGLPAVLLMGVAAIVLMLPLPASRWPIAAVLLLLVLQIKPAGPAADEVWVTVLDVGQGTSILIQSAGDNWVYDLGRSGSARFNSSEHNLLPLLRRRGIKQLDGLVISHADNDHYGAYQAFLQRVPVAEVWLGEALPGLRSGRVRLCQNGMSDTSAVRSLKVLLPFGDQWQGNNASCVVQLIIGGSTRWLLPGDIERTAERALNGAAAPLRSDVVLAPHHGSITSSSPEFVAATSASKVIVSAAYRHHFGHPHPLVSARWQQAGATVLNVAECGALEWRYRGGQLDQLISWREQQKRWWHDGDCPINRHAQSE